MNKTVKDALIDLMVDCYEHEPTIKSSIDTAIIRFCRVYSRGDDVEKYVALGALQMRISSIMARSLWTPLNWDKHPVSVIAKGLARMSRQQIECAVGKQRDAAFFQQLDEALGNADEAQKESSDERQ